MDGDDDDDDDDDGDDDDDDDNDGDDDDNNTDNDVGNNDGKDDDDDNNDDKNDGDAANDYASSFFQSIFEGEAEYYCRDITRPCSGLKARAKHWVHRMKAQTRANLDLNFLKLCNLLSRIGQGLQLKMNLISPRLIVGLLSKFIKLRINC